jgi:hypothetical protein
MRILTLPKRALSYLFILTTLSSRARSSGNITYINNCGYPMYIWETGYEGNVPDSQYTYVAPYDQYTQRMTWTPKGGISAKIRDVDHYATAPAGILQIEYRLGNPSFFYDLSYIDCDRSAIPESPNYCPFAAGGVRVTTSGRDDGDACRKLHCQLPDGECELGYLDHGSWYGEPSMSCPMGNDLFVETCVDGEGAQTMEQKSSWDTTN